MKLALINGSPKSHGSASGALLTDLRSYVKEKTEVTEIGLHKSVISEKVLEQLKNAQVWVISCPLYVDGIPSHLLSCLIQLENAFDKDHTIHVYGIVNCGFYEGIQAEYALELLQNWCIKAGLVWSGGIGVGGGGGLNQMPTLKNGHGPKAPIYKALHGMADKMLQLEIQKNNYVSVAFPRFLYKMAAQAGWRQMIKANGGSRKDLGKNVY